MKKKAVLLGDSIRLMGYGKRAAELLADEYTVFQPNENCRYVKFTLRLLFDLREEIAGADVIHWNNGLWDTYDPFREGRLFSSVEEYTENILRVAERLQTITPNVIFATTTPVRADTEWWYDRNGAICRYNEAVVPELKKRGILINDLHSLVEPHATEYICEKDWVHLTPAGSEACALQVAEAVRLAGR